MELRTVPQKMCLWTYLRSLLLIREFSRKYHDMLIANFWQKIWEDIDVIMIIMFSVKNHS